MVKIRGSLGISQPLLSLEYKEVITEMPLVKISASSWHFNFVLQTIPATLK